MDIPIYQVDAFSRSVFSGNPAAVCPLERWLSDVAHASHRELRVPRCGTIGLLEQQAARVVF